MSWGKIGTIHGGGGKKCDQVCQVLICCLLAPNSPSLSLPCHNEQSQDCKLHFSFNSWPTGASDGMARREETIYGLSPLSFLHSRTLCSYSSVVGTSCEFILQHRVGSLFYATPVSSDSSLTGLEFLSSLLAPLSLILRSSCFLLNCFRVLFCLTPFSS